MSLNKEHDYKEQDKETFCFRVEAGAAACRLDRFLSVALSGGLSREKVKKAILAGDVLVEGAVCLSPKLMVGPGQEVCIGLKPESAALRPEEAPLEILYRDARLAVLNKPGGLTVHPCPSCPEGTLAHRLLAHFPELAEQGGERPGIVHRLDKDTTGLILAALDEETRLTLSRAFAGRMVKKEYLALVYGVPEKPEGSIDRPIGRHPIHKARMAVLPKGGREAISDYRTLYADRQGRFALLAVRIHTGRTHQIRVHLGHLGHSIVGDGLYFNPAVLQSAAFKDRPGAEAFLKGAAGRPLLHAWKISLKHPQDGKDLFFCCPPPEDFYTGATALARSLQRIVITGNPGCGKSSVLGRLKAAGMPVWSADAAVSFVYEPGRDGYAMLKARFGQRFLLPGGGGVDKKALFKAMHDDEKIRHEVEQIVHPIVLHSLEEFWKDLAGPPPSADAAAAEVPLYFETGAKARKADPGAPLVAGVFCPFVRRRERLAERRGWSGGMIDKMESWQWPEDKKVRAADLVLDNSGSEAELERAVAALNAELKQIRLSELHLLYQELQRLTKCPDSDCISDC